MPSHCPSCGASLPNGAQFCISCGRSISDIPDTGKPAHLYTPTQLPRKINPKTIAIIGSIVVAIIIVIILVFVLLGSNNSFIGKWSVQPATGEQPVTWTVYEDNSVKQEYTYFGETYTIWGYWEVKGEQVCGYWESDPSDYRCIRIEYSEGGNRITGYYNEELYFTGTRIG